MKEVIEKIMKENKSELFNIVGVEVGIFILVLKEMLPAEVGMKIMSGLAVGYAFLRSIVKILKIIAITTPGKRDDRIVEEIEKILEKKEG